MYQKISSIKYFESALKSTAVLAYFSTKTCSVCSVLKPKIAEHISTHFPKIKLISIKMEENPELAAQYQIFTAPTLLLFFEGNKYVRKSRAFGINELHEAIERPYNLLF